MVFSNMILIMTGHYPNYAQLRVRQNKCPVTFTLSTNHLIRIHVTILSLKLLTGVDLKKVLCLQRVISLFQDHQGTIDMIITQQMSSLYISFKKYIFEENNACQNVLFVCIYLNPLLYTHSKSFSSSTNLPPPITIHYSAGQDKLTSIIP